MASDRGLQPSAYLHGPFVEPGRRLVRVAGQSPVAALTEPLTEGPRERSAGQELVHSAEERLLAGDKARGQELGEDPFVKGGTQRAGRQNRLDLRREEQLLVRHGVIERLDP